MLQSTLFRATYIQYIFLRYGLGELFWLHPYLKPFRFLRWLNPWHWQKRDETDHFGERLRIALEALGPIFVKFGQVLSTRQDILPTPWATALAKLQDQVTPFPTKKANKLSAK